MCGFAGIAWKRDFEPTESKRIVERMTHTIRHRGPDSDGRIETSFARVGFRRLSIIDLVTGDQPASNETGSIKVFLNGEIYNFRQLKQNLERKGHRFKGRSDTEVLPHLYEEYGEDFVHHLNGMFTICLCDINKELLYLYRDRTGIKPMYYACVPGAVVFGSEIKALLASGLIRRELDVASILPLIDLFYCPGPDSLIKDIKKLLPGQVLTVGPRCEPRVRQYYEMLVPEESEASPPDLSAIEDLLCDSVRLQMLADVPVGVSLSGGIDSSIVSMYAAKTAGSDVTVFTVKFEDTNPEELNCAAAVAGRLGLKHVVLSPSLGDFMSDLARMVWYCDEPVADPASYSAMKVAEAASSIVKVLLSGTGGDELFGGYYHYWLNWKRRLWIGLPRGLTSSQAAHLLCSLFGRGSIWSDLETFRDSRFLWHCKAMSNLGPAERQLLQNHIPTSRDPFAKMRACFEKTSRCDIVNRQLFTDFSTYLPDQLLTMLDRTTMSASIEGRVPFLDHRLSETMFRVRGNFKLGNGSEYKALLKTLGRDVLPREVIHRQKMGFPCGALDWLGKDLLPLLEKLLLAKDTFAIEYLPAQWLREMCQSPESIRKNERTLYTILVIQIWYELFIKRDLCEPPEMSVLEMFGMKPL